MDVELEVDSESDDGFVESDVAHYNLYRALGYSREYCPSCKAYDTAIDIQMEKYVWTVISQFEKFVYDYSRDRSPFKNECIFCKFYEKLIIDHRYARDRFLDRNRLWVMSRKISKMRLTKSVLPRVEIYLIPDLTKIVVSYLDDYESFYRSRYGWMLKRIS